MRRSSRALRASRSAEALPAAGRSRSCALRPRQPHGGAARASGADPARYFHRGRRRPHRLDRRPRTLSRRRHFAVGSEPIIPRMRFNPGANGRVYPGRLVLAALVLPVVLLGGLIALDFWLLEPAIPSGPRHLALLAIGAAGVIAFSMAILARLGELHGREIAQTRRLQALNTAGLALSAELELETLLHKIADLARIVGDAEYAALATFDDKGVVTRFYTSGIDDEERAHIGHLPV